MSLIPRSSLFDTDNFPGDFWGQQGKSGGFFAPRVDVRDRDDHYEISAELPGVKKEDIHVTLADGLLTLEAETREDRDEKEGDRVIRQERRYGRFQRSFNLGPDVHEEDVSASFDDGVLTLRAPKRKEPAPTHRRIQIS